jgi:hypothetical protein
MGGNTYSLGCPSDGGVCYETDGNGSMTKGSTIIIHYGSERIPAVIMSAPPSNVNPNTPIGEPTTDLPESAVVSITAN